MTTEKNHHSYAPLYKSWQPFFTEYIYRRVSNIFGQPIAGNPGGVVRVLERISNDRNRTFYLTGKHFDCINLASYDYLGFSRDVDVPSIERSIRDCGVGITATSELGYTALHRDLERMIARFVGKEAAIVFGMGFATNAANIPSLIGGDDHDGTLIIGDQNCHASVRAGIYLSRAKFQFFKHNDFNDLERKLRRALVQRKPGETSKWRKVIVIVEGVYSMEGTIVDLPRLLELKHRYRFYLYIDEAHSIGAIGPNGRGVCDYFGVDPAQVDMLMGTFTKSFAASGGYIAGSHQLISYIRANSASNYAGAMAAPVAQQIINTLNILMQEHAPLSSTFNALENARTSKDVGHCRIQRLLSNTHYLRDRLKQLGFIIIGNYDSPVIPIMVYFPSKVGSMVHMAVRNGLALVAAGYPATSLISCRIRLCMSASLDRQMLDQALQILSKIGDEHQVKYAKGSIPGEA